MSGFVFLYDRAAGIRATPVLDYWLPGVQSLQSHFQYSSLPD